MQLLVMKGHVAPISGEPGKHEHKQPHPKRGAAFTLFCAAAFRQCGIWFCCHGVSSP